jgi:hypothetical protein
MTKRQKALERLLAKPQDFEWNELRSLMESLGYQLQTSGGSGRKFVNPETRGTLFIHEPHPAKVLKLYQVKDAIDFLRQENKIP